MAPVTLARPYAPAVWVAMIPVQQPTPAAQRHVRHAAHAWLPWLAWLNLCRPVHRKLLMQLQQLLWGAASMAAIQVCVLQLQQAWLPAPEDALLVAQAGFADSSMSVPPLCLTAALQQQQ
jgi:hypothetical protein